MLRVGVVGLGAMGQHHARLYSELPGCRLVGVADADPARALEIAGKYQTTPCTNYADLVGRVDAVSIVVPTTLHRQVSLEFMKHGVHCLVEKPIASTVEQAEEMVQTASENKVKLLVGHIERFNPAVQRLKQIIDSGMLGEVMMISTRRVGPFVPRIRDVGIIIDSASHDIDVARYLLGKEPVDDPLAVFSRFGSFKHLKEDHAIIVLDFGDATANIEVNWFTPHKVRTLVATGSEAIAYLDYIDQTITVRNSHETEIEDIVKGEPLKLELEHFIRCVKGLETPLVAGEEGLKVLKIALQAAEPRPADRVLAAAS